MTDQEQEEVARAAKITAYLVALFIVVGIMPYFIFGPLWILGVLIAMLCMAFIAAIFIMILDNGSGYNK